MPDEKLTAPKRWTKMVFGPSAAIESRSEVSKPRMSDVIPTIEVTPMTTPSTVSAERILLPRSVSNAMRAVSRNSPACRVRSLHGYSRLNASIGSSIAARRAGYHPKNRPTTAVMVTPSTTDQDSTEAGNRRQRCR